MQEMQFDPWVRKILWRSEWLPTPVFLPGEFHGQRKHFYHRALGTEKFQVTAIIMFQAQVVILRCLVPTMETGNLCQTLFFHQVALSQGIFLSF